MPESIRLIPDHEHAARTDLPGPGRRAEGEEAARKRACSIILRSRWLRPAGCCTVQKAARVVRVRSHSRAPEGGDVHQPYICDRHQGAGLLLIPPIPTKILLPLPPLHGDRNLGAHLLQFTVHVLSSEPNLVEAIGLSSTQA